MLIAKLFWIKVSENPGFKLAEVDKIANLTIAVNQHPGFGSVCLDEKQVELYKGRRPYQKITMEHYALQDDAGKLNLKARANDKGNFFHTSEAL